jgi:two-component system, LuxR family, sensor kinase FixL
MAPTVPDNWPGGDSPANRPNSPDYEVLLRAVVEGAVDGVVTIDERGSIQWCNPATEELFGYQTDELIGRNVSLLMPAPTRQEHDRYLANYLSGGPPKIIGVGREVEGRRRDGSTFPIDLAVTETIFHGRRVFTGIMRDLTEKKEAEQRAFQNERLAAIGQMMTGLIHESRNALQRILACVEMLELEVADQPAALDWVRRIAQAQSDLQRLFAEVRNFAKPRRLETASISLADTWREAWELVVQQRAGRETRLIERLPPECSSHVRLECEGDPFQLNQVFRNLMENSLAACGDPVEVEIECRLGRRGEKTFWEVHFRDNGPGLNEEQRARIFEPFYTTKAKGTGLGMAIAQRIVEAHGGTLTVGPQHSGAEFILTLPCSDPQETTS